MTKRLLPIVLAAGLFAAGCGDDKSSSKSPSSSAGAMQHTATASTGSGASDLRASLTSMLQEHVYLAGIAVSQGVAQGLDSKQFTAAANTLDANSQALADAIGSVYGDDAGKQFL